MRVMVLVKADERSEAGVIPSTDELNEMGRYNDELVKAGIMLAADGLRDSSHGHRVRFADADSPTTVLDGPFTETKELIAGFWIWQVSSIEEALEWAKRAPFRNTEIEVRPVFEAEDFGENFTPEMREAEQRLRDEVASRQQ